MKKYLIAFILGLSFSFVACNQTKNETNENESEETVVTEDITTEIDSVLPCDTIVVDSLI